jgi:hypothetical protein
MWITNEGESRIHRASANGQVADLTELEDCDRTVRPAFLRALLQGRITGHSVDSYGIQIKGAVFSEDLNLDHLECVYPIVFHSSKFLKETSLRGAKLKLISFVESEFSCALDAMGLSTSGYFHAWSTKFDAGLFLSSAQIGSNCLLSHIIAKPEIDTAVALDGARIAGNLLLCDVDVQGQLFIMGAQIGGHWLCEGKFQSTVNQAILADFAVVSGGVKFGSSFCASGSVSMIGVSIGQDLNLIGGTFAGCDSRLFLSRSRVSGLVNMTKCRFESQLLVNGACFSGNWVANTDGQDAAVMGGINARGITVMGDASLGHVCPDNTSISKWDFTGGNFQGQLTIPSQHAPFQLLLGRANIVTLDIAIPGEEGAKDWELHGLQYGAVKDPAQAASSEMLKLIRQSDGGHYFPQPYRQLFRVLREAGHADSAVKVAVAMNRHRYDHLYQDTVGWQRTQVLIVDRISRIIDYGYSTHRLYQAAFWIWLSGAFMYSVVGLVAMHHMVPTMDAVFSSVKPSGGWYVSGYPGFSGPIYALDHFLPIVDFGQATMWHPRVDPVNGSFNLVGWFLTGLNWLLVASGWLLTTLLVTAASGVMRRVDADQ